MKEEKNYLTKLLKSNDIVVLACSGGPDSMCLLHLLEKEKQTKSIKIICAHLNHNIRKESEKELLFVKKYCQEKNIVFEEKVIEKYPDNKFSEQKARNIRYAFLEEIVKKYHAKYLMTAHHGDDLMETILMRIVRGSTLSGYGGFKKETNHGEYQIIKPLITSTKEEIIKYNQENKIEYKIDSSNESDAYTRNRYRQQILPFLKKENQQVHKKFLKFNEELCQIDEFLMKYIDQALTECMDSDTVRIMEFKKLDSYIKKRVLEKYLKNIYQSDIVKINSIHIDAILKLIENKKSQASINLPNKLIAKKSYNQLKIEKDNKVEDYQIELKRDLLLPSGEFFQINEISDEKNNNVIRLSYQDIELPLYFRNRHIGDKMSVKNFTGTQKISDIMINEKINHENRLTYPLLVDSKNEILWVPGIKKSKFDKEKSEKYDIIVKYFSSKEKKNDKKE